MQLTFNKISGKWYVDLPEWKGSFDDLEMVSGADDLLEVLSMQLNIPNITFDVWTSKPDVPCASMKKIEETFEGATYQVNNCMFYNGTAWLCNVTKFVFGGYHPIDIYFRVADSEIIGSSETRIYNEDVCELPSNIEYKKLKVTVVNLELKKSLTFTANMKMLAKCKSQNDVKLALEEQILESRVFTREHLSKLKYQGRKEVLEEWAAIRNAF